MERVRQHLERNEVVVLVVVVYLSFLMDNVLLTVVVPIMPDYLFSGPDSTGNASVRTLSPLQEKFERLERENGPLGALLASKAFVQLIFTPFFGWISELFGYDLPLLFGSGTMFLASICKYYLWPLSPKNLFFLILLFPPRVFAYGKSYGVLVFARGLHGTSSAAVSVSGMCLLAETIPYNLRSKLMPIAFGGIALGVLIGYPLGGAANQILGKEAPFLLIAFCVLANVRKYLSGRKTSPPRAFFS